MKKLFTTLFVSFMVTFAFGQTNFTVNGIKYTTTGTNTVQVSKGVTYTGAIIIQTSVTYSEVTYNVTSIGSSAFSNCTGLTSVTIPSSVTTIGDYAFVYCFGLTSVIIPSSVTSIGTGAFENCSGLTSATIPSSVTSIGMYAFTGCSGLITVDTVNQNYSSQDGILYNKTKTLLIQCPTSKSGSFIIPSSVSSIVNYAFSSCIGLTSITIPSSITSIGNYAFENCSGLTSVTIPSSVTSIGGAAFSNCSGLTSVTIPSSVTSISGEAFSSCSGLTSITIPSSVTSISGGAFSSCSGLTSITIPSSVTSIGDKAFYNCSALSSIIAYPLTPIDLTSSSYVFYNVNKTTCTLYMPSTSLSSYQSAYQWNEFKNIRSTPLSVETSQLINITTTTASGGGSITSDGGFNVTARGVCWSITADPTIANNKTIDGIGSGYFISNIIGFNPGITYHIRAYATNSSGTVYGDDLTFTALATIPILNTTAASLITSTTATTGGSITSDGGGSITSRGVCWSTSSYPTVINNSKTIDGNGTGTFSSNITELNPTTTYHIRAYATNSAGTAYGNDLTFTTLNIIPTIITTSISSITSTTATSGSNITTDGGFDVTARGVCWNTSYYPTIANSKTNDGIGTGSFISNITGLTPGTTYYIRAYATNIKGTAYGNHYSFTTLTNTPILNTTITSLLTGTTVTTGGIITTDGGFTVTARGVCWSTTSNPTIANSKTTDGTGIGTFTRKITGLNPGTTYHVRAYATNSAGTAYGDDITFTTLVSSTEVYLNNIAFISSAQDGAQSNVPSTMVMNSSNPYNFMNPGKTIRFKMQCFNKKSNGINIVSGSCKVRCNDPYFTLTDSTSGLNNVGYNASAWSSDEFEIQIKSTTPWGYVGYVDFEVIEGSNSYFTYKVPIPIAPLSLQSKTVDDDNNPDSKGNGNGICEPNEIIESLPSLKNVSSLSANSVYGLFNNYYDVSGISIWNNKQGVSGTVVNSGYWNYAFGAPQVITAGTKDMIPQWDFVFDYNFTNTYHFTIGLIMSGKFQLFSAYQSYIRWLVPVEYNTGSPEFNTGIRNKRIQELTVYPNPTYGKIIIVLDVDIMNEYTINLSNVLGQKVYSSQLNTEKLNLDLSNYCSKGIYFLQLLNDKGIIVGEKKVIFN